jgi:hypothetical protein
MFVKGATLNLEVTICITQDFGFNLFMFIPIEIAMASNYTQFKVSVVHAYRVPDRYKSIICVNI